MRDLEETREVSVKRTGMVVMIFGKTELESVLIGEIQIKARD